MLIIILDLLIVALCGNAADTAANETEYEITQSKEPDDTPKSFSSKNPSSRTEAELEKDVLCRVNKHRVSKGLRPLKLDQRISEACRKHSADMAFAKAALGHEGYDERIEAIQIPYQAAAENVAANQGHADPAGTAVEGWMKSRRHRNNMEGDYDLTGVGVARNNRGHYFFTQIFIHTKDTPP